MSTNSAIEWTDVTWNPVAGCAKVSPGCKNCYAQTMANRLRAMATARGDKSSPYLRVIDERGRWTGDFETLPSRLAEPLSWRTPKMVFVNSMSDLFGEGVPFEFIAACLGVMMVARQHTFQVLTKRLARMLEFFAWLDGQAASDAWQTDVADLCLRHAVDHGAIEPPFPVARWPLPNVWLGGSVEDQRTADERIPLLLEAPAAIRFISAEPLLGELSIRSWLQAKFPSGPGLLNGRAYMNSHGTYRLDWVIVGGESGPGARPCKVSWIRSIVQQCSEAGVACFVKQFGAAPDFAEPLPGGGQSAESMMRYGEYDPEPITLRDRKGADMSEWPEDLRVRQFPEVRRGA